MQKLKCTEVLSASLPDVGQDSLGQSWVYEDVLNFTPSDHSVEIRVSQLEDFLILLPVFLRHHPVCWNSLKYTQTHTYTRTHTNNRKNKQTHYHAHHIMMILRNPYMKGITPFKTTDTTGKSRQGHTTKCVAIHTRYAMMTWIQKGTGYKAMLWMWMNQFC